MEEKEQFFNTPEQEGVVTPPPENDEELIPIKVRDSVRESIKRASQSAQENRQLLAAYQAPQEEQPAPSSKTWAKGFKFKMPPQHRRAPRPAPDDLTDTEKQWAAMAHGSALVTIAVGLASGGIGALLT